MDSEAFQRRDFQPERFRVLLQNEHINRCRRNPRYSLRAFARSLGIESSSLSKLMSGKRRARWSTYKKIADRLNLTPADVRALFSPPPDSEIAAQPFIELSEETFSAISDWYNYAILELTHTAGFEPTPRHIARALGITQSEAKTALERLVHLRMLEKDPEGDLKPSQHQFTNAGSQFSNSAMRTLQKQLLEKAATALDETPFEERDQTGMAMAINPEKLPEAKKMIDRFRRSLCRFLEDDPDRTEVYQLVVSLYPLSRNKEKRGSR